MTQVRGRLWRDGVPVDGAHPTDTDLAGFDLDGLDSHLADDAMLVWVDVADPDHATLLALGDELGLDPWAVEDAVADAERTKATVYRSHTFFTVYAVRRDTARAGEDAAGPTLRTERISAFVLPRGLVTVRLSGAEVVDVDAVSERFDELGGQSHGVGALVHALLDVVVDGHFVAVQAFDDAIEALEEDLFDDRVPGRELQRRTFDLRKELVRLRRVVLPMREVVTTLQHRRLDDATSPELDPVYADLHDHVLRASEWTDSLRDMLTTLFETNLSLQDARLNVVVKKLTSWAAIIAVPTAVTGFYGQNVRYPGVETVGGFLASVAVMVVAVVALFVAFRRRDWL